MTREETKQAIEVMQAFVDGGEVEYKFKPSPAQSIWMKIVVESVYWDWANNDYRIAKPETVNIPLAQNEIDRVESVVTLKHKKTGMITHHTHVCVGETTKEEYYYLDRNNRCWVEWLDDLEYDLELNFYFPLPKNKK